MRSAAMKGKVIAFMASAALLAGAQAMAAPIQWTDWTSFDNSNGFTAYGNITAGTSTVDVTYFNQQGVAGIQTNGGVDYWTSGGARNPATSPYTSDEVDNIPTGTDIIRLNQAGPQTLSFSETVANLVFSYVSLNGNGYSFSQDFEILSFGDPSDGNACGYWGCGTSYKQVVGLGGGNKAYQLLGTGEPHGTIRFLGTFSSVTWNSLTPENWNGFTVGVEGTAADVCSTNPTLPGCQPTSVAEPSTLALFGLGLTGLAALRRRSAVQSTKQ